MNIKKNLVELTLQYLENWSADKTVTPYMLRRALAIKQADGSYQDMSVQYPLPADGDSVYAKDIWLSESSSNNWSGSITDLFDNLHTQIANSDPENPKTILIHFNRTIVSNTIGLGDSQGGDFSNTKIEIINSGNVANTVVDESSSNTKYTTRTFQLPVTAGFNALRITFHTADTISLTNLVILKTRSVVSRGQAVKPDGTVIDLNATAGGNQKQSLEEFDDTFLTNPLPIMNMDYLARVKAGLVTGHTLTQKFGRNSLVGTSFAPIALNGVYQTPSTNQTLEMLSSNAGDTSAGAGARKVLLQGKYFSGGLLLDQEEEVTMNGTTPVTLTKSWARTPRMFVLESGTYASMTSVSALGTITLRDQGGSGVDWLVMDQFSTNNSAGQSQCALYTTPNNTRSVLYSPTFSIDSNKVGNIMFFHRPNADVVVAPFSARRVVQQWDGIKAPDGSTFLVPFASFTGAVDMGFMGKVSVGTGSISANFWLLEVQDGY